MLIINRIKNLLTSNEYKMKQLIKVERGEIKFKDIKYLVLQGYSRDRWQYPDESYIFISNFLDKNCSNPNIKTEYRGFWKSGVVKEFRLTVKDGICLIERTFKPN